MKDREPVKAVKLVKVSGWIERFRRWGVPYGKC